MVAATTPATDDRIPRMRALLEAAFAPTSLTIKDESVRHARHHDAATGGGHYRLEIVSAAFAGMRLIEQHRAIYTALDSMLPREIHALSISSRTA